MSSMNIFETEQNNFISWEMASGRMIRYQDEKNSFKGFKLHSQWDEKFLVSRQPDRSSMSNKAQRNHLFRKISISDTGVVIDKEFYHNYRPGSKLYLGQKNDVLLEFTEEIISVYQVKHDKTTLFICDFRSL